MYGDVLFLRLYGPLRVSVDDEVVIDEHFTRRKAKALLVLLYLERDSYVPRDELLEKLWPSRDAMPADSGRLKQTVLVLRRALETGHSRRTGWQYIIEKWRRHPGFAETAERLTAKHLRKNATRGVT